MQDKLCSIGNYLAIRFEQAGLKSFFAIPGDYNLLLLDEMLKNKSLQMINCCNELNAGYAADGYARVHGLGALVVTYSVGGLSALNAVAGAYAEDVPLIVISGAPRAESELTNDILHHTLGEVNYRYVRDIYAQVTAHAVTIKHPEDAPYLIDEAFKIAIQKKKPVYIEIPCNNATRTVSKPQPLSYNFISKSNQESLSASIEHAAILLNGAQNPVLVAGVKLRAWGALSAFQELVSSSRYSYAAMANAKGFVSEQHPQYIGIYWGRLNDSCATTVESSDLCLFAGPLFTDYTMAGFSNRIDSARLIHVAPDFVTIAGQTYNEVSLEEFLGGLSKKVKPNDSALKKYKSIQDATDVAAVHESSALTVKMLYAHIQKILNERSLVIAETGDTWANAIELTLPEGCGFEIQLQYASIGWSIGAALGCSVENPWRRIIALVGDGSLQMSVQEISTMIRFGLNPIIIVINNNGYLIEKLIHDGPYNIIQNWKYSELISVFNGQDGKGWGCKVATETELISAFEKARKHNGLCLIEVITRPDDSNKNSIEFGKEVAAYNNTLLTCSIVDS